MHGGSSSLAAPASSSAALYPSLRHKERAARDHILWLSRSHLALGLHITCPHSTLWCAEQSLISCWGCKLIMRLLWCSKSQQHFHKGYLLAFAVAWKQKGYKHQRWKQNCYVSYKTNTICWFKRQCKPVTVKQQLCSLLIHLMSSIYLKYFQVDRLKVASYFHLRLENSR